jgi:GlpG protein
MDSPLDILSGRTKNAPAMTFIACILCVVVFIGLQFTDQRTYAQLEPWGWYSDMAIWQGKPWVMISSVFVHLQIWHIGFNVYWLWLLGSCLEMYAGSWRWLLFFFAAAWVSSAFEVLAAGGMGIGISGVVYALFGFGWIARPHSREFRGLLSDQTVQSFVIWLFLCIVLTATGALRIGNAAHFSGLAFGALVAAVFVRRWRLAITVPALIAVVALSFVPLFWCPLSPDWNAMQAMQAQDKGDLDTAIAFYQRSLARGAEPGFVWANIALIEASRQNAKAYIKAIDELRKVDSKEADRLESAFGTAKEGGD